MNSAMLKEAGLQNDTIIMGVLTHNQGCIDCAKERFTYQSTGLLQLCYQTQHACYLPPTRLCFHRHVFSPHYVKITLIFTKFGEKVAHGSWKKSLDLGSEFDFWIG